MNLRHFPIIAIGLIIGILCMFGYFDNREYSILIYAIVGLSIAILIFIIISKVLKLSNPISNYFLFYFKYYLSFIISLFLGILICSISLIGFFSLNDIELGKNINGTISSFSVNYNYAVIQLTDITNNENEQLAGNCTLLVENFPNNVELLIGDRLSFDGEISHSEIYGNDISLQDYVENIKYNASCDYNNIAIENQFDLRSWVKNNVYEKLDTYLNSENSAIAMSIFFGDKTYLNDQSYESFSLAGVAHILAVSGLHIGVLVGALAYLLKMIKLRGCSQLLIILVILILYSYLCGFSPSVCRASIMSIVLLGSKVVGFEYDPISSISIAAIILLIINPLWLFSIGFQLSFLAVLGIITMSPSIAELFKKIKLPQFLNSGLSITITANILILPVTIEIFKSVSFITIFSNIIILPIFSILYVVLFFSIFISLILPFFSFVLWFSSITLHFLKLLSELFASINFASITLFHSGFAVLSLTCVVAILIKFLMVNNRIKTAISTVLLIFITISLVLSNLPITLNDNSIVSNYQYSSNTSLIVCNNNKFLVGIGETKNDTKYFLEDNNVNNIEVLLAYDFDLNKIELVNNLTKKYNIETIYLPQIYSNIIAVRSNLIAEKLLYLNDYVIGIENLSASEFNTNDLQNLGLRIVIDNKNIVFLNDVNNLMKLNNFVNEIDFRIDYLFINKCKYNLNEYLTEPVEMIYFHNENISDSQSFKLNKTNKIIKI